MDPLAVGEAVAGGALLLFVPGFAVAKAVFPDRRLSGPDGWRWGVELVALALVLSVVLTVIVGDLLLVGTPGGFHANWGDPLLETALAAVALVAFVAGVLEGAYARVPPRPSPSTEEPGAAGAWELSQRLERLQRERGRIDRQLRATPPPEAEAASALRAVRARIVEEERTLRERREAAYEQ